MFSYHEENRRDPWRLNRFSGYKMIWNTRHEKQSFFLYARKGRLLLYFFLQRVRTCYAITNSKLYEKSLRQRSTSGTMIFIYLFIFICLKAEWKKQREDSHFLITFQMPKWDQVESGTSWEPGIQMSHTGDGILTIRPSTLFSRFHISRNLKLGV